MAIEREMGMEADAEQNGKQGENMNLNEANAAATSEAAQSSS